MDMDITTLNKMLRQAADRKVELRITADHRTAHRDVFHVVEVPREGAPWWWQPYISFTPRSGSPMKCDRCGQKDGNGVRIRDGAHWKDLCQKCNADRIAGKDWEAHG